MMNKQAVWLAPDELAELRRLANVALTCAPSQCVREQACCDLARGVLMRLPPPVSVPPEPDEDPDEVQYYCCWETHRPRNEKGGGHYATPLTAPGPRAPDWSSA